MQSIAKKKDRRRGRNVEVQKNKAAGLTCESMKETTATSSPARSNDSKQTLFYQSQSAYAECRRDWKSGGLLRSQVIVVVNLRKSCDPDDLEVQLGEGLGVCSCAFRTFSAPNESVAGRVGKGNRGVEGIGDWKEVNGWSQPPLRCQMLPGKCM
jgi:hypothetical protein